MKVGLAQINAAVGDFRGNTAKIQSYYQDAVRQDCGLVVFPELALTGCHPRDLLLRRAFVSAANKALETLARRIGRVPALVGTVTVNPDSPGRCLFNTVALLRNGAVEALFHKRLLASHDAIDEDRYFEPGVEPATFEADGVRVGVAIGYDLWNDADFWEDRRSSLDPVQDLLAQGCNVIVNPTACAWSLGKDKLRRAMMDTIAREDGVAVLMCNMVGSADGLIFDGGNMAVSGEGLLAAGTPFQEQLVIVDLDAPPTTEESQSSEEEQLLEGLILGARDFLSKSGQRKAVVPLAGLNGAVTAVIAARAMEPKNVVGVVVTTDGAAADDAADARKLAETLGIEFHSLDGTAPLGAVRALVAPPAEPGQEAAQTPDNVSERLSAFLLALASERHLATLLTTPDKTDIALAKGVHADCAGSLAVLGDVPKTIVSRLAEFINRDQEIIPAAIMARVKSNEGTEGMLNPHLVDAAVARYVDEDKSVEEIVADGFDRAVLKDLVHKIDQAESLRHKCPPCLNVTSRAFGPGRRMPLVQRFSEV